LLRYLARLGTSALAPIARRLREREGALAALLRAVPPSQRAGLYDAAWAGADRSQARPPDQILEVLPRALRQAEARRVLGLGPVRNDAALTLHHTAFLPWEQAKAPLAEATRRAVAGDRAAGYERMLACAARSADPGVVTEVITGLRRLRNEQDPVRARALTALARISPRLLRPEVAGALEQITGDALAARDTSNQARQALSTLAVAALRCHAGSAGIRVIRSAVQAPRMNSIMERWTACPRCVTRSAPPWARVVSCWTAPAGPSPRRCASEARTT
jgi:hypothetical protein